MKLCIMACLLYVYPICPSFKKRAAFPLCFHSIICLTDDLIGSVCKHLSKRSIKYTAMFTGEKASGGMVCFLNLYCGIEI